VIREHLLRASRHDWRGHHNGDIWEHGERSGVKVNKDVNLILIIFKY